MGLSSPSGIELQSPREEILTDQASPRVRAQGRLKLTHVYLPEFGDGQWRAALPRKVANHLNQIVSLAWPGRGLRKDFPNDTFCLLLEDSDIGCRPLIELEIVPAAVYSSAEWHWAPSLVDLTPPCLSLSKPSVNILLAFVISHFISQHCWEVGQCGSLLLPPRRVTAFQRWDVALNLRVAGIVPSWDRRE